MGSSAAGELILFIGALTAASVLAATLTALSTEYAGAIGDRAEARAAFLQTQIEIINDPEAVSTGPLLVYVMNTGELTVDAAALVVLVDGQAQENVTVDVLGEAGSSTDLAPGSVAELTVGVSTATGDHHIQIIPANGPNASFAFYQP